MAYVRANSSCSACAKTSYTMASKSAVSSIISAISVGPAIWSILVQINISWHLQPYQL